ncbi:protein unc-80 homolog [Haliotis cracherodii]|uniref:protein unc-80 homolog n=1 Tax=Haliotis cracherodii TaxID=6455 RepID=UPI0039E9917B
MTKRKTVGGDDLDGDQSVPLPIQTFFWRQISPFIRPKQGKMCDAACVSFERVVVQNILHGLSPSLCEAIQSVSRWKTIQAAFPHLMHASSSLLTVRKQTHPDLRFGPSETKLLYTLHWIMLDAASECEDADTEKRGGHVAKHIGSPLYMHSLSTVQLFVYLFAPVIHTMKDSDFDSLKLENGLRLWQPLWDYRQPDIPCFSTPVKPQRSVLKATRNLLKVNTNAANIYIGKGTSRENLFCFGEESTSRNSYTEPQSPGAPIARMSDICAFSAAASDSHTATMDVICENCNTVMQLRPNDGPLTCRCGQKDTLVAFLPDSRLYAFHKLTSAVDKDYVKQKLASAVTSGTRAPEGPDILSASYLDVAVLRCLFCLNWNEDGIYWALRYMHQRMLEVSDEYIHIEQCERSRSKSLPVPDLQVLAGGHSKACSPEDRSAGVSPTSPDSRATSPHRNISPTDPRHSFPPVGSFSGPDMRKEPPFKKIRVIELKQFFDTGKSFLRKKDSSELDGSGSQSPKTSKHDHGSSSHIFSRAFRDDSSSSCTISTLDTESDVIRPNSAMGSYAGYGRDRDDRFGGLASGFGAQRKSMPTLPQSDKESFGSSSQHSGQDSSTSSQADIHLKPEPIKRPIITITEHSPEPKNLPNLSASNYELSGGSDNRDDDGLYPNLPRSMTDSNISYKPEEDIQEVSGSKHYIQDNGHINYKVVLRAVHFVAMNERSPRICEVLLNILNCLLDLDIIETKSSPPRSPATPDSQDTTDKPPPVEKPTESDGDKDITAHSLAMDSLFRIYKALGCPQGCGDGIVGPQGDHLRMKGQNCLQHLHKLNPPLFHKFLRGTVKRCPLQDTIDFLHAFLGFCVDPTVHTQSPQPNKKSVSQENLPRNCYANNFGHSIGGEGYRGVEGVLIANLLKPFVSRCVESVGELYGHDNIGLFCDVRQMMAYVKEVHGGQFRKCALSGLLDSLQKLRRQKMEKDRELNSKPAKPVRRTTSITSESGDEKDPQKSPNFVNSEDGHQTSGKSRRSIFRKKVKKVANSLMFQYAASDSEIIEDMGHGKLSPRTSISATDDEPPSGTSTPRRRFSKFNIGWKRGGAKSDHEEESANEPPPLDRRESKSEIQVHRKGRMSFKAASHATLTFLSARKRIEDGIKTLGKRMTKRGSHDDFHHPRTGVNRDGNADTNIEQEKRLVDKFLIKSGMLRFSFLLECCHPGVFPDPHLVAAMLDLDAPVSARASLLLECAHFIHRCNRGDWPNWMKLNLPSFRHTVAALQNRGQPSGYRRNLMLQKAAGRLFYSWAENLGNQMEYILAKEHSDRLDIINDVKDEGRRKELRTEDDEEDFLDEASVNSSGTECPYALKMLGCLVLMEITTFLRETFQYLPRSRSQKRDHIWEKTVTSRRFSSIVSSPGHSDKSSESNVADLPQSTGPVGSPGDRKISFAVLTERSDSFHSSTTSISVLGSLDTGDEKKDRGRRLAQGRQKLLRHFRRGSGQHNASFRHNRSFKLKRAEGGGGSIKHAGSIRSRKVSSQSLQSEAKFVEEDPGVEDTESVTMLSDDTQESPVEKDEEAEDEKLCSNFPWIKVVVQLANLSNFICTHQNYCHPNCYERQRRSCSRLITSLRKVYHSTEEDEKLDALKPDLKKDNLREKLKRRESIFQLTSPTRRRESTPLLEKIKTDVSMTKLKLNSTWKKDDKPKEVKEEAPVVKYLTSQAQRLTQCPMAILTKAAPILRVEHFIDIMPVAWELLLESDQELAAAAATVFLLSSAKSPDKARNMIVKELQHEETGQRINAVLRFGALWRYRYQVWPRMEEGANNLFKVPPPSIDFTLPSPTIGLPKLTVVDPPWMPHFKAKIEEVTLNLEDTKSLVTTTTTRRKQQQEMIRRALQAEEERKRVGRENFPMTTIPVCQLAAFEPALHHASEDHEEATQEENLVNMAARRVSLAPVNRANIQSRSMSWRNGSLHWGRLGYEGEEDRMEHPHHLHIAQTFFPSCICAAVLPILHLLDDQDVNEDGISVTEVASKVIWDCIVEDPVLFLRHFLEKLTHKDRQEELMFLLRKLVLYIRQLPAQTAHSLFNYLIGYVMFYVRSPCEGGQEAIAGALSLLWMVTPCVEGIYFKDLKQTLKKEQCDPYLLVSAYVASAKKILVHGPDLSSIPSQLPIHEDTQFSQILSEGLEFFNIPEDQVDSHFLVDTKTYQIQNLNSYVRDFYFFRRNFYPQLSLVRMNPDDAFLALQKRVFTLKFVDIGKVLFTTAVLGSTPQHQIQNHVSFLHEEFLKHPAFPRKALEAEFDMYHGPWGKELYGMDTLHKYTWTKLMTKMFDSMSPTFAWSNDMLLFLNVINGTIVLLFEDTAILRYCLASLINTSRHFKHIFSTNGFLYIMPTLLRVYSNNQPNLVLKKAIHFVCRQFYILHRKPFILQMFGSVAPILDMTCAAGGIIDCSKVQPSSLFKLLLALEKDCPDTLGTLDLVRGEKPLKALDFCYENDSDTFNMLDVINMCITVIAYSPDSFRSGQMLTVLEVLVPRYLQHLKRETTQRDNPSAARAEISLISSIASSLRSLISCCEYFTRNMSIPQRYVEAVNTSKPVQNHSVHSLTMDDREDSHASRYMEEGRRKAFTPDPEDLELRTEFRKPRDSILSILAEFYTTSVSRLRELRKILADPNFRTPDLLDHKTHNRLAEIAHTLLKLAPYDPLTMRCTGLQRYMAEILPSTDWSQELIRPALNLILRRLDRLFTKLSKKPALRRQTDWEAAANILKGVYLTLRKFLYIAHLPHLKTLVSVLISILLSGSSSFSSMSDNFPSQHGSHRSEHSTSHIEIPALFCSSVVKLVAMQMQALGEQWTLEQICGGPSSFQTTDKTLNMLVNFILPLCIRVGCGRRDIPKLEERDVVFILTLITNLLSPSSKTPATQNNTKNTLTINEYGRCSSLSNTDKNTAKLVSDHQQQVAYVGLEILLICFDKQLASEWHRVSKCIQMLASKGKVSLPLWKFLDFLVTHRPSLFLLLQTFVQFRMMKVNCDTAQEYYLQQTVKDKLMGYSFTHPKSVGTILLHLATDLKALRDDLPNSTGGYRSRTATFATDHSDYSHTHPDHRPRTSITEITAEILGHPKPNLAGVGKRASRGTIFSQSSTTSSAPLRQTTVVSSDGNDSPTVTRRKSSKRISTKEGTRILEKFNRKNTVDDTSPEPPTPTSPRLQRQATICLRGHLSKQTSLDDPARVVFENEEVDTANGAAGGRLADPDLVAALAGLESDPGTHRLQRQDAKSRKTFKIKRTKTKTSTNIRRFMSARRGRYEVSDHEGSSEDSPIRTPGRMSDTAVVFHDRSSFTLRRPGVAVARSVETIPESVEVKTSRPRFVPRSKSHDDPSLDPRPPTGRIYRQGARIVRSRSPSLSPASSPQPTRRPPPPLDAASPQAYVVTRCDSSDSLSANESSALLRDDDKSKSMSSLYYADEDVPTKTRVV